MNTTDIDPSAPPTEKKCTTHLFLSSTQLTPLLKATLNPGSQLQNFNTSQHPPAILFDAIYASAVLYHFGTQELKDQITKTWKDMAYTGYVTASTCTSQAKRDDITTI
jgi:hypothetical protein